MIFILAALPCILLLAGWVFGFASVGKAIFFLIVWSGLILGAYIHYDIKGPFVDAGFVLATFLMTALSMWASAVFGFVFSKQVKPSPFDEMINNLSPETEEKVNRFLSTLAVAAAKDISRKLRERGWSAIADGLDEVNRPLHKPPE